MRKFSSLFLRLLASAPLLGGLIWATLPAAAHADVNKFTVTGFSADYTLTNPPKSGGLHVIEHITVDFTDLNHGLERALPKSYKGQSLDLTINRVSSDTDAPNQYTTYSQDGNLVLRIGDPNRTVTGRQEYNIEYTEQNVISFFDNHDELYWDVNGDQWLQPFTHVSAVLHLPITINSYLSPLCFTGNFGSTDHNCTITQQGNDIAFTTTQTLTAGQTLSIVVGFQKGYFAPLTFRDKLPGILLAWLKFLFPLLLVGLPSLVIWFRHGRDVKGSGVIVPQYTAPDGLTPLEVGGILEFGSDNRDLTATLIDLAIRHYFKIIEKKGTKKDKPSYRLELIQTDYSKLNVYEAKLMRALFGTSPATGTIIKLGESKARLHNAASTISSDITDSLTKRGYFDKAANASSLKAPVVLLIAITPIWLACFFLDVISEANLIVGVALAIGAIVLAAMNMPARTGKGVATKEHIEGLKLYLSVAEAERIKKLQSPNAAYAPASAEPQRTVELFEKLLPYAIVLQVEKEWAGQFQDLYATPPVWYNGYNDRFMFYSFSSNINSAINSSFTAPASSSSSGFGGGGFAGGGGGGGGGGGW